MFCQLSSYYRQIAPQAAGSGPIGGHLTESSLKLVFQTLDTLLSNKNLEWKDQVFVDLGSGEGYPLFFALLEKKCQHVVSIDIARLPLKSPWNAARQLFSTGPRQGHMVYRGFGLFVVSSWTKCCVYV